MLSFKHCFYQSYGQINQTKGDIFRKKYTFCLKIATLPASYLASREDLSPFLTLNHLSNVEQSLSNLTKLQIIQDIISLIQTNLSPTQVNYLSYIFEAEQNIPLKIKDRKSRLFCDAASQYLPILAKITLGSLGPQLICIHSQDQVQWAYSFSDY